MKDLKNLFKTLLLREENVDYNSPFWEARWIEIKVDLLSCRSAIKDIKKLLEKK